MHCKNCGTIYDDKHNFCPECGARNIRNRLTPDVLAKQVNEEFLSVDNKLLKTFICLFTKPEDVIVGYINGTRKKYLNVVQYFAFSLTLVGLQIFLINVFFKEDLEATYQIMEELDKSTPENNPFKMTFEDFFEFYQYQSFIYVLSIPLYAIASWFANLIMRDNFYFNFTEHLVLNIYYYAQIIIITSIISILFLCFGFNYFIASGVVSLLTFIYLYYTLKRVFNFNLWNGIAFFLLAMVGFLIIGGIVMILLFGAGFLYGYYN